MTKKTDLELLELRLIDHEATGEDLKAQFEALKKSLASHPMEGIPAGTLVKTNTGLKRHFSHMEDKAIMCHVNGTSPITSDGCTNWNSCSILENAWTVYITQGQPVPDWCVVSIRIASTFPSSSSPRKASEWDWGRKGGGAIVAYRIVAQEVPDANH